MSGFDGFDGGRYEGAAFGQARGSVSVPISASRNGSAAVAFPTDRFTLAPNMGLTPGNFNYTCSFSGLTATGCTVNVNHVDGTVLTGSVTVHWQAEQATDASAID